jgi:hypothetical protein
MHVTNEAGQLVITREADLYGALLLLPLGIVAVVGATRLGRASTIVLGTVFAVGFLVVLLWWAADALCEISATFDGVRRILTVRRRWPWGTADRHIRFDDVLDVEARQVAQSSSLLYRVDIRVIGDRRIRLSCRARVARWEEVEHGAAEARALLRAAPSTGAPR